MCDILIGFMPLDVSWPYWQKLSLWQIAIW